MAEGRTNSISLTFFLSSLYLAWYLTSSAPPGRLAVNGFVLCFAEDEGRACWWYIWLVLCKDGGPGEGWRDMVAAAKDGLAPGADLDAA